MQPCGGLVTVTKYKYGPDPLGVDTARREIAKAGEHPRVVLEATYGWWAADVL